MNKTTAAREIKRRARHQRIRRELVGTPDQPRLCVHRSLKNFCAQIVDDSKGKTILGMSTRDKDILARLKKGGNVEAAKVLGEVFAKELKNRGISKVCFDRGGYLYHGRVKAFADAAREQGLVF